MPWKEVSVMSQRLEFVQMASGEQANIRQLCRHFNISAPTAYKWLNRFQESGPPQSLLINPGVRIIHQDAPLPRSSR